MPRPSDSYTHSQFENIDSNAVDGTVRCVHCKQWTGSSRPLNRKKEHLLKCPAYAAWRAAGNGQDLAPPNPYSKRISNSLDDDQSPSSPYGQEFSYGPQYTPSMTRNNRLLDLSQFYDEFWDDDATQKCMRARCKYCGTARAKNSTRQYEHLSQCSDFLDTTEGQQSLADGSLQQMTQPSQSASSSSQRPQKPDMFRGIAPNPTFARSTPNKIGRPPGSTNRKNTIPPTVSKPSLINYLLSKNRAAMYDATQQPFLSHAGCGTLSPVAVGQFFTQQNHISRAMAPFIGKLIGKIRLPAVQNPQADTEWRALDLLASCVNNAKRELEFLRTTKQKYSLQSDTELPRHATKSIVDLMESAASPGASLLEGMMVLWAIEYLHYESWQYAERYHTTGAPTSTSYSLPTYYTPNNPYGSSTTNGNAAAETTMHTSAMYEALIPNWTSAGFSKFVDACKAIVDELANSQTSGNGVKELNNAEQVFGQLCWLWRMMWPEVTGMGEEDDTAEENAEGRNGDGTQGEPIEVQDGEDDAMGGRDEDPSGLDSPFGGTGLGVVDAANRATTAEMA